MIFSWILSADSLLNHDLFQEFFWSPLTILHTESDYWLQIHFLFHLLIHRGSTIFLVNSLWIDYLLCELTMNPLFLLELTFKPLSILFAIHGSSIYFANVIWIYYLLSVQWDHYFLAKCTIYLWVSEFAP